MSARLFISIFLAFIPLFSAQAHEIWTDGSPVPAWVKAACCGVEDVHHLGPDQVHRVKDGYIVDGYPSLISEERLLPSHDGEWWVFYKRFDDWAFSDVYCFFGPVEF